MPSWVYITASVRLTLYTGVTTRLEVRVWQHKTKRFKGFSAKYNCDRLIYFEQFDDVRNAICREKEIKGWSRRRKMELIKSLNPELADLAVD